MKGLTITLLVLIFLGLVVGGIFYFSNNLINSCELEEVQGTPVSISQAQSFALFRVTENNKPYTWIPLGYLQSNDINGEKNYYVFIFVKDGFNLNTLDKLKSNILTAQSEEDKYQFNDVATIVVSAIKEEKQLIRHFRGLPEYFVEEDNIESLLTKNGEERGNLILDNQGTTAYFEILSNSKNTGNLIRVSDKKIISSKDLIDFKEASEQRRLSAMSSTECEQYKIALQEASQAHIAEWNKFS
ncbi:MAG: hypothetical protein AABX11_01375 [Nanoarchaeota archaeon]